MNNHWKIMMARLLLGAFVLCLGFAAEADTSLRLMAANITSGNNQSYDPGEGTRIFQGLKPDVAMIQEFNYSDNSATSIGNWVKSTFGTGYTYVRGASSQQIPNGIISRWPILESGEWTDSSVSNRDFLYAHIDLPGTTHDLWAVSVHLLTSSASNRNTEATQLVNYIKSKIPSGDYLVIGGDFNTASRSEAAITTFQQILDTRGPYPVDQNGTDGTNASRAKPYDWVLTNDALNVYEVPTVIGSSYTNGLVFDSRVFTPLSAVSPVQSGDSGATNMQHMAVVRDFKVPADGSGGTTPTTTTLLDVSNVSVAQGKWKNYQVTIPTGATQLKVDMSGSGDGDLYLRYGSSYPTTSTYDYCPCTSGSTESVTATAASTPPLQTGNVWISVYGYAAATVAIKAVVTQ